MSDQISQTEEQLVPESKPDEMPIEIQKLLALAEEQRIKKDNKLLLKQRVWYQGNLITKEAWDALSWEERHVSNNVIRK